MKKFNELNASELKSMLEKAQKDRIQIDRIGRIASMFAMGAALIVLFVTGQRFVEDLIRKSMTVFEIQEYLQNYIIGGLMVAVLAAVGVWVVIRIVWGLFSYLRYRKELSLEGIDEVLDDGNETEPEDIPLAVKWSGVLIKQAMDRDLEKTNEFLADLTRLAKQRLEEIEVPTDDES